MPIRTTPFAPLLVAALLAGSLSACGSDDDDDDTGGTIAPLPGGTALTSDDLRGTWSTGCALEDADDPEDGYRLASLAFDDDAFAHSSVSYRDAGCTVALPDDDDIELAGTFALGDAMLLSSGLEATTIDFSAVPPDGIAGATAGTAPRTLLDIVHVDGTTLYLGDGDFDDIRDTDADERPDSLELDEPYTLTDDDAMTQNDPGDSGTPGDPGAAGTAALTGDARAIESIDGAAIVDTTEPTIGFTADGRVFGDIGCNSITGEFESEGDTLRIGTLATTLAECGDPDVSDQERRILELLDAVGTYSIDGDGTLRLVADDGRTLVARAIGLRTGTAGSRPVVRP